MCSVLKLHNIGDGGGEKKSITRDERDRREREKKTYHISLSLYKIQIRVSWEEIESVPVLPPSLSLL